MSSRGRPRLLTLSLEELYVELAHATTTQVAARYGVNPSTVRRERRLMGLVPARRGRPPGPASRRSARYGSGPVQAAILACLPPDRWVDARTVRQHVPGTKQAVYHWLACLCAGGILERRGRWRTYEWRRATHTLEE